MEHFLEMLNLIQGGRRWYEIKQSQEMLDLGAIQHTYSYVSVQVLCKLGVLDGSQIKNSQGFVDLVPSPTPLYQIQHFQDMFHLVQDNNLNFVVQSSPITK